MSPSYSIVWFKRDLRLHDHAALDRAASQGPILCLYVIEPKLWAQPDAAHQHYQFILESLQALDSALQWRGGQLLVRVGAMTDVLDDLYTAAPFSALYAHEETGNAFTFERDRAVATWCRQHQVRWQELPQFGVIRRLKSRNNWSARWEQFVASPCLPVPSLQFAGISLASQEPPYPEALGLSMELPPRRQNGGRLAGIDTLRSFLEDRSNQYRGGISSPLSAPTACSRLSPYLTYGCLGLREVVQATQRQLQKLPETASHQRRGLAGFVSRLHWHCHFIQKLESEPELEYRNLHSGYNGLREGEWNQAHFQALTEGRTGWPLVDACVAMLRETGWLNFRMRAMLVSVAAYPLWLHWRPVGLWLARQFLDYEPGIHWSQMQMQSGTTGINTTRIYNPIKQARDHDPQGQFVRRWLPAMRRVPDTWLFEPWRMPEEVQQRYGVFVGKDIPIPLVDLETATRAAKARIHALRAQPEIKAAKAAILEKHGSRKRSGQTPRKTATGRAQLKLEL